MEADLLKVFVGLLTSQLELEEGQVLVYNQKFNIPKDDRLYMVVAFNSARPFATYAPKYETSADGTCLLEIQSQQTQETYQISIYSRGNEARLRKHEVIFALNSTEAQRLCEKHGFHIGTVPVSFVDLSHQEASAILNRYAITFNVLRSFQRQKVIEYYDTFENPPKSLLTNE